MSPLDSSAKSGADQIRALLGPTRLAAMQAVTGRVQLVWVIDSANGTRRVIVRGSAGDRAAEQLAFANAAITVRHFAPGVVAADTTVVAWVRVGAMRADGATGGALLSTPQIRVRGQGSLRTDVDSILVVIDGRVAGRGHGIYEAIPADSIESIDILKDPSATARYGKAGRDGVIVVTRRHGAS